MLLAIDVGNTQTVVGLFEPILRKDISAVDSGLVRHWRISTASEKTSDEVAMLLRQLADGQRVSAIAIAAVVPSLRAAYKTAAIEHFGIEPSVLLPGINTSTPISIGNPREVGADRLANAIGAQSLYDGNKIVVDFGTAITVDAIDSNGAFLGGATAPGTQISIDALYARASALQPIELIKPNSAIGKSTAESIRSGVLFGFAGLVDGLCERFSEEFKPDTIVATGGLAELIAPFSQKILNIEPLLTLHGVRLFHYQLKGEQQ
jgi:type III pantothenate kinase